MNKSRQRWKILAKAVVSAGGSGDRKVESENVESVSVRRFKSFGLFNFLPSVTSSSKDQRLTSNIWTTVDIRCNEWPSGPASMSTATTQQNRDRSFKSIDIKYVRNEGGVIDPSTLIGFNNTGNVCIWPAEEILAYYLLQNLDTFKSKKVIELGSGMTGLAGFVLAANQSSASVTITDGNCASVENLREIQARNELLSLQNNNVSICELRWKKEEEEASDDEMINDRKQPSPSLIVPAKAETEDFDFVIGADCFFFDSSRRPLLDTTLRLLKPGGQALFFAPSRSGTFDSFVELCRHRRGTGISLTDLSVTDESYDQFISGLASQLDEFDNVSSGFDRDLHYPLILKFKK